MSLKMRVISWWIVSQWQPPPKRSAGEIRARSATGMTLCWRGLNPSCRPTMRVAKLRSFSNWASASKQLRRARHQVGMQKASRDKL